jgi:hypothetical protein
VQAVINNIAIATASETELNLDKKELTMKELPSDSKISRNDLAGINQAYISEQLH